MFGEGGVIGREGRGCLVHLQTFKKASFTLSSFIIPLRHRFAIRSALEVPELRHAMVLVVVVVLPLLLLLLLVVTGGGCCCCLRTGIAAARRRVNGLLDGESGATLLAEMIRSENFLVGQRLGLRLLMEG